MGAHLRRAVCHVAYANYFTDARIKNYVECLLQDGFEVDVIALGRGHSTRVRAEGGAREKVILLMRKHWGANPVVYALAQVAFALLAAVVLTARFVTKRYAVVHVHNMPNFLTLCALVPRALGARVILDVHDTMPEAYATKFDLSLRHPLIAALRFEERLGAAVANAVITTNTLHKRVLVGHGIPEDKIEIVMNVAHPAFFGRAGRPEPGPIVCLYHGTIAERLGLDLMTDAFARAAAECEDLRWHVIGEGDFEEELRGTIRRHDLGTKVTLLPFVPVEDLAGLLARGHVGLVGNRRYTEDKENFMLPVKMLEYAAMGIPTVAPRLQAIEAYFDDRSALFYEPDDPADMAHRIVEVCRDPAVLERLREGLEAFNQQYNWAAMETLYLRMVGDLMGRRTPT